MRVFLISLCHPGTDIGYLVTVALLMRIYCIIEVTIISESVLKVFKNIDRLHQTFYN